MIVKPIIQWVKCKYKLDNIDFILICQKLITKLHYKKIIVWCGLIDLCFNLAELWKNYFNDFIISVDTSKECVNKKFNSLDEYLIADKNAILFCACKHREGSDIKNLDGCIFLDKVENRNPKTFVQCIGRVLRKDKQNFKKFGLILDLKASSCIKLCDRMNQYLNSEINFPWEYTYYSEKINNKNIFVNTLNLIKNSRRKRIKILKKFSINDLIKRFIRKCPVDKEYQDRLQIELEMIQEKQLSKYLLRSLKILELTNHIPHVTRGSCGSSLVCFLLGISNVDPIQNGIKFERFLNEFRSNLPDIDLDFPHYLRDEVFLKLELNWPNRVARISNHVYWHEKSALREAIRRVGINKMIPKNEIYTFIKDLPHSKKSKIYKIKKELEDTFRHYSLHCGGIVFFEKEIPKDILLNNKNQKILNQILLDKNAVSKNKDFKIDILSSRGISQLIGICGMNIDFTDCPYDEKTYKMLQSGDNIGITLAESPLMRKALIKVKPKSINDLAICLAIIRPAAKDARIENNNIDYNSEMIFDDDAIEMLSKELNINYGLADKFRRCFSKGKWDAETKYQFNIVSSKIPHNKKLNLLKKLSNLRQYGFCKAHSYSYAQLVYKLAYQKAHNKKKFWESTVRNVKSSYRKWVHLYEARLAGVNVNNIIKNTNNASIYAENRREKFFQLSKIKQLKKYGYWNMTDKSFFNDCYFYKKNGTFYFAGLIASMRILKSNFNGIVLVTYLGVGPGKYIEILIEGKYKIGSIYGIKGRANLLDKQNKTYKAYLVKFFNNDLKK